MRQKSQDAPQTPEPTPQALAESAPAAKVGAPAAPTRAETAAPAPAKPATLDAYAATTPPASSAPSDSKSLSQLSGAELEQFLIDFVVEQTGYPPEMVEMDADLEADLGIDSIKKAQLFGELAERFEIAVDVTDESLSLDDFPTLKHVMDFLENSGTAIGTTPTSPAEETAPESIPPSASSPSPSPTTPSSNGNGVHAPTEPTPAAESAPAVKGLEGVDLESFLVDFVVEQTGYPPEMVEMDADLEADLGIDSIKKAQLFGELAEQFEITVDVTDESLSLDDFPTLRHVSEFLRSAGGGASAPTENAAPAPKAPVETPALQSAPVSQPTSNGASANGAHSNGTPAPDRTEGATNLSQEELETFLVNFVVEQTGYPPDMVELDADLEADLGIDSIKKAQLMGELAEQFEITVDVTDENLSLDDFPTLRHVCEFLAAPGKVTA